MEDPERVEENQAPNKKRKSSSSSSSHTVEVDMGLNKVGNDPAANGAPKSEKKQEPAAQVQTGDGSERSIQGQPHKSKCGVPGAITRNKGTVIVTFLAAAGFATGAYFLLNNYLPENIFRGSDSSNDKDDRSYLVDGASAAAGILGGALGFGASRLANRFFCNTKSEGVEMQKSKTIQVEDPGESTSLLRKSQ